jgi:DNA recombination protein RmuC
MENTAIVIALPIVAFIAAWALVRWRAQGESQQLHTELEVARAELARLQGVQAEQQRAMDTLVRDKAALDLACVRLETERNGAHKQLETQERACAELKAEVSQLRQSEHQAREARKGAEIQAQEALKSQAIYQEYWESSKAELKALDEKYAALSNQHSELTTSLDEKQRHFAEQLKLLQDSRESQKKEFEQLATEILERKGKAFKELNQESISNLLNPLHTEMKGFKAKVEDIHARDAEQRVQLRTELQSMQKLNREITDQADKLTTALRGQKKVQGNWGELMLENVLDNSGLRLGTDYRREVSFNTEDGRQRPDAIVYLPQKKHLIIDAKTSLVAYTEYVNADSEPERSQAIAAHARAVGDRITELADRDYFRLPGLNSPEVVVMFIPIESAYVEALKYDDTLFQRAIERNVLVATPTTLLTSLNIVRQLWRFEDQNKHTAELANRAEKFYSKLNGFLTSMQGVGSQLDRARLSYDKAFGQLYSGKGNLIKQAAEFKDLGVSVQKELPADLVERASLELGDSRQGTEVVE